MDDVRIYNRTLSADEIAALYLGQGSRVWNPRISLKRLDAASVQLNFDTVSGAAYQVEYTTELTSKTWTPLGAAILGSGSVGSSLDLIGSEATRFYRVRPLP